MKLSIRVDREVIWMLMLKLTNILRFGSLIPIPWSAVGVTWNASFSIDRYACMVMAFALTVGKELTGLIWENLCQGAAGRAHVGSVSV